MSVYFIFLTMLPRVHGDEPRTNVKDQSRTGWSHVRHHFETHRRMGCKLMEW